MEDKREGIAAGCAVEVVDDSEEKAEGKRKREQEDAREEAQEEEQSNFDDQVETVKEEEAEPAIVLRFLHMPVSFPTQLQPALFLTLLPPLSLLMTALSAQLVQTLLLLLGDTIAEAGEAGEAGVEGA